jgi:hypothetical protein
MNGSIRPRTTHTAAWSGTTATPTTGTNDTSPNAAAAISVSTNASAASATAARLSRITTSASRPMNATAPRIALATPRSSTTSASCASR